MDLQILKEAVSKAGPGEYMLQTTDQRGDGYDIACTEHRDEFADLEPIAAARGAMLTRLYANGFFCGYILKVPDDDIRFVLAQHEGNWGPWYHVSAYHRKNNKWVYSHHVGGHYNKRNAPNYPTISELRSST